MISLEDVEEHIKDLRTALTGLAYALGRQPTLDAELLRTDLLEVSLAHTGNQDTRPVAIELLTLLAQAIERGRRNSERQQGKT